MTTEPSERFRALSRIFDLAVDAPEHLRDDLIRRECQGDPALEREVRALLAADAVAESEAYVVGVIAEEAAAMTTSSLAGRRLGAWAIERLTDELEAEALGLIGEVDALGGMVEAIERGFPQQEIQAAAYATQRAIERGDQKVVGVNCYPTREDARPSLLRVDPPVDEKPPVAESPLDDVGAAVTPETAPDIVPPAETAADEKPVQPESVAALSMEERPPAAATEAVPETPAAAAVSEVPAADVEIVAAIPETLASPAANETVPVVPAPDVLALEGNAAATRIATLGGPAVIIDEPTSAGPDRSILRKQALQRARERRRIAQARRARLAREAALVQQQQINPVLQAPSPAPTPLLRFTR